MGWGLGGSHSPEPCQPLASPGHTSGHQGQGYSHDRLGVGGLLPYIAVGCRQATELALEHSQGTMLGFRSHLHHEGSELRSLARAKAPSRTSQRPSHALHTVAVGPREYARDSCWP